MKIYLTAVLLIGHTDSDLRWKWIKHVFQTRFYSFVPNKKASWLSDKKGGKKLQKLIIESITRDLLTASMAISSSPCLHNLETSFFYIDKCRRHSAIFTISYE